MWLSRTPDCPHIILASSKTGLGVMSKANYGQQVPHKRDLGGVSSIVLAAIALVLCLEWSLLIHLG
jgi:hypothetical protein